ncbi:MAG: response regulator transcription factor [Pseudomonadota bacterium]
MQKVLIVDDHPLFRRGLLAYFDDIDTHKVVAHVGSSKEALLCLRTEKIDIVLLDINLPDGDGFELLLNSELKIKEAKFIILTMHDEIAYARKAFALGAAAFMVKDDAEQCLQECLAAIAKGERFCSLGDVNETNQDSKPKLSPAEERVFHLVSKGKSSYEIADQLNLSVRTIDNHRANIAKKLGLRGSNALLKHAMKGDAS